MAVIIEVSNLPGDRHGLIKAVGDRLMQIKFFSMTVEKTTVEYNWPNGTATLTIVGHDDNIRKDLEIGE